MIGRVDNVEFTFGSFGHQWTTIDGRRFITWWDWNELNIRPGVIVEYTVEEGAKVWDHPLVHGNIARIERIVQGGSSAPVRETL
jgi:hypothetical protein